MAAKLEIILLTSRWIGIETLLDAVPEMEIGQIICIKDWAYNDESELFDLSEIQQQVQTGNIVIVELQSSVLGLCGIHIERSNQKYVYTIWIDTKAFPELDEDYVTESNRYFYNECCAWLIMVLETSNLLDDFGAIGVETVFEYDGDLMHTMETAQNMVAWVVPQQQLSDEVCKAYCVCSVPQKCKCLLFKVKEK